jgi:hypothetical protein
MARKKAHRKQQQQQSSSLQHSASDLHELLEGAHLAIPECLVAFLAAGGQPNATIEVLRLLDAFHLMSVCVTHTSTSKAQI